MKNTTTITVRLTPELKKLVDARIRSGRYLDQSEVVREALRMLEQANSPEDAELEALIEEGFESGAAQPLTPRTWREIWTESDAIARTLRQKRKAAA